VLGSVRRGVAIFNDRLGDELTGHKAEARGEESSGERD
jgi:hypothetical protein